MYNTKEPPDIPFRNRGVLEVKYLFLHNFKNSSYHLIQKQLYCGYETNEGAENFLGYKSRVNLSTTLFKALSFQLSSTN